MELIEFLNDFFSDNNEKFSLGIDTAKAKKLEIKFTTIYEKYIKKYNQDFNINL